VDFDSTVVEKSIEKKEGIRVKIEENADFFKPHTLLKHGFILTLQTTDCFVRLNS